ncbi:MAG: DsrE family protein [Halioglobus sp.]
MAAAAPNKKTLTVIITHAPYQGTLARAGLDAALAAAAFEQPVQLIFSGHGIYSLLEQDTKAAGTRSISKLIASLPLYDIEPVYAEAAAIAQLGINADALPAGTQVVDKQAIAALIDRADHVVSF